MIFCIVDSFEDLALWNPYDRDLTSWGQVRKQFASPLERPGGTSYSCSIIGPNVDCSQDIALWKPCDVNLTGSSNITCGTCIRKAMCGFL